MLLLLLFIGIPMLLAAGKGRRDFLVVSKLLCEEEDTAVYVSSKKEDVCRLSPPRPSPLVLLAAALSQNMAPEFTFPVLNM